jgi:hypothetical protein
MHAKIKSLEHGVRDLERTTEEMSQKCKSLNTRETERAEEEAAKHKEEV